LVAAIYDTELFGHWWFEGIDWLEGVLRHLASSDEVHLTTSAAYLEANPPETVINLPEGSWGAGGTHFVWDNVDTSWMWPLIHQAEGRMREIVQAHPAATADKRHALDQAARELLLLQSSDWPFLVTTGQAKEYAIKRFREHLDRFNLLIDQVERGASSEQLVQDLWQRDKIYPEMDYRWFRA
jgi:1,4-alpha-glucan branching enzyme